MQAEATLDYLVSCGARLSAMTRAYHDVEAVTRLLAEKEKDLELAAKIGQELLERNRFLDEKVQQLEAQVRRDVVCLSRTVMSKICARGKINKRHGKTPLEEKVQICCEEIFCAKCMLFLGTTKQGKSTSPCRKLFRLGLGGWSLHLSQLFLVKT